MKRKIKAHLILFILTFLLLTFFSGLYFLIKVKYLNAPEDLYYFNGETPTSEHFLISGIKNLEVIVESLIISLIITIINYFINLKHKGLIITSLKLTFLTIAIYSLYKLIPTLSFDHEYFYIFLYELEEEVLILGVLYLIISVLTIGLIRLRKRENTINL